MTASILVVDDVPANVRLLEARLSAEFFDVKTADNGRDALRICGEGGIDLVLLDIMMPGMDGFEVCERLKADPATADIPVVMVTALDGVAERVRGLKCGADDFLTKPVNDIQLMARVRSLVRVKALSDELRQRAASIRTLADALRFERVAKTERKPRFLIADERQNAAERMARTLCAAGETSIVSDPQAAVFEAAETLPDCIIVATGFSGFDALRVCSQIRALERTRSIPIILSADDGEVEQIARALDMGVNDYIVRPCDDQELLARIATQLKRKRLHDRLRTSLASALSQGVTDALTGVNNRNFLDAHLQTLLERAVMRKRPLSLLAIDIDRLAHVNGLYGEEGGDRVLKDLTRRIQGAVRPADLLCRYENGEFVVVMPDTDADTAETVAERLRSAVAGEPFQTDMKGATARLTVSVGVATLREGESGASALMALARKALREAKDSGRNRVVSQAA